MARLRFNNIGDAAGSTNAITLSSATTNAVSWASSPGFPTISAPDFAVVVAEPGAANEEIMYLVGYVAGATTGLVVRAQEGTAGASHSAKGWVHGPTAADFKSPSSRAYAIQQWS